LAKSFSTKKKQEIFEFLEQRKIIFLIFKFKNPFFRQGRRFVEDGKMFWKSLGIFFL
jgi:hypothetical protein